MQFLLANLNPSKASGPDSIPNWLLKEYADFLCRPLTVIFNASFKEQRLPHTAAKDETIKGAQKRPAAYFTDSLFVESCRRVCRGR